jgi:N-acetylglucosaminyldiphosphoundecaprenol N-acetyl-beta-D-mannosaminyltransferase
MRRTCDILGFNVANNPLPEIRALAGRVRTTGSAPVFIACANPHSLWLTRRDRSFADAIRAADILLPDGVGVLIAARILGGAIVRRVTGWDAFAAVCEVHNAIGGRRHFFLGSTPETLSRIVSRLARDFPRVEVAGTYAPPFTEEFDTQENCAMIEAITASRADVLWVALTAPKQEKWIAANKSALSVDLVGAVGAVFDFYAGTVQRAGPVFQALGLEWAPRLIRDPRRLWRRTCLSAPAFFLTVLRERIRQL